MYMDTRVITVTTQTTAIKAQRTLQRNGIPCKIVRPSPKQTPRGCTWGIGLDVYSVNSAIYLLEDAGIPFGDVIRI